MRRRLVTLVRRIEHEDVVLLKAARTVERRIVQLRQAVPDARLPMTPLDLGEEAGAESLLRRHLDAHLLHESGCQLGAGYESALDEHLAEALAALRLGGESLFELVSRDQPVIDEQLTEQPRGDSRSFHE